jgi:hypothetical protein
MLEYQIIADGNIVAATAGSPSTILTTLSAYDSTFHDLWSNCVMVHDDMIWTLPLPWTFFPLMSPPPSAALPPAPAMAQLPPPPYASHNPAIWSSAIIVERSKQYWLKLFESQQEKFAGIMLHASHDM